MGDTRLPGVFFNPFPKYLQVRDILIRRLQHELSPGDEFPSEHALCAEFGVSRKTIREALRGLEADGLIGRHRGHRTVVLRRAEEKREERLTGLVESFTELRRNTSAKLLAQRPIAAAPEVAAALGVPEGELVYLIERLRVLDGRPLARHQAYLPVEIGVRVARLDLTGTPISTALREILKIEIREDYQQMDAVVAGPDMARLLDVPVGAPLLVVRRLYLDRRNRRVVLFQSHFRSDRYFYTVKFPRAENAPVRQQTASPRRHASRRAPAWRQEAE